MHRMRVGALAWSWRGKINVHYMHSTLRSSLSDVFVSVFFFLLRAKNSISV